MTYPRTLNDVEAELRVIEERINELQAELAPLLVDLFVLRRELRGYRTQGDGTEQEWC